MGKELVFMPECHSTNTVALERCQHGTPSDGAIIITNNQHGGRGQRGNTWVAAAGQNLTFSIILKPSFLSIADQHYLNICAALAVADYLDAEGCQAVSVKWPNDVYVNSRKVCGILIESQLKGVQLVWSVMGIGLNINQQSFNISTATSLSLATGRSYDLNDVFAHVVGFVEARYLQLRQGSKAALLGEYEARLYWANEVHRFESPLLGAFSGSIAGVDSSGRLRIRIGDEEQTFAMKEVSFIS